jgi:hypothetical protein
VVLGLSTAAIAAQKDHKRPIKALERLLSVPVNLVCEMRKLMLQIDDLVQPRADQIFRISRLMLLRPRRSLRRGDGITFRMPGESKTQIASLSASKPRKLAIQNLTPPNNESCAMA